MLHQIGVGALGPVFRTYEPDRDRLVAVKVFRLDITPEQAQALADELLKVADAGLFHPSIVESLGAGVEGSTAYVAEEYVAAESLDVAMRDYAPAPAATVLPLVTQLAGAIDFARAAGVGHGALHPRDIFVTSEEVRASGFGVVEALERVGLRAPVRRPYSAPERIDGSAWSTPADVFSLGAIAFELLTGRRPAGLGAEVGPLSAGTPNSWTDALHAVLARAMDPDPDRRHPTALALASALEAAARGDVVAAGAPMVAASAPPSSEPDRPRAEENVIGLHEPDDEPLSAGDAEPDEALRLHEQDRSLQEEDEADIVMEREDDEAYQRLVLHEMSEPGGGEPPEVAPSRFGDDFREPTDATHSGGASAREPYAGTDTPGFRFEPVDDAGKGDRSGFETDPLEEVRAEDVAPNEAWPEEGTAATAVDAQVQSYAHQPQDPDVDTEIEDLPHERRGGLWMAAVLLLVGLVGGVAAGYAIWGRAAVSGVDTSVAVPAGRDAGDPAQPGTGPAPDVRLSPADGGAAPMPLPAEAPPAMGEREAVAATAPEAGPTRGTLVVRSAPGGAGVTVNGTWRGRTPLTLGDLPFARYQVRVVEPGYAVATETVTLSAGSPEGTVSVRLAQQKPPAARAQQPAGRGTPPAARGTQAPPAAQSFTGSIYVDSRPRGATVSINGKPVGVTPLRIPEMRIGTHVVRLELPDHRIWSSTARVTADQEARVTGSLDPIR